MLTDSVGAIGSKREFVPRWRATEDLGQADGGVGEFGWSN